MPSLEISKNNSKKQWNLLSEIFVDMALCLIELYRICFARSLDAFFGVRCRFTPTCSCYAQEALRQFGFLKGIAKGAKRLSRCHPWGDCGFDPVTPQKNIIEETLSRGT